MAAMPASTLLDSVDPPDVSSASGLDAASETLERRAVHAIDLALARLANASRDTGYLPNAGMHRALVSTEPEPGGDGFAEVVNLPARTERWFPVATLHPLQEWEGYVVEIGDTDFTARLVDLTAGSSYEEEEATVPLGELSDNDIVKLRIGSLFRWVIGYERSLAGTKKRVSQIVLRDLPAVTEADRCAGRTWAREMMQALRP